MSANYQSKNPTIPSSTPPPSEQAKATALFLAATLEYYAMSVMQAVWSHPTAASPNSPPNPHQMAMPTHHFHFPPTGLLAATANFRQYVATEGRKLSHAADGERGLAVHGSSRGPVSSWSPRTDIRQTKLAYHIEIEVPGTTDKEALIIQWLSPTTLIVGGEIERPFVGHGKSAEGASQWQQGEEENVEGYPNGGDASKQGQNADASKPVAQDSTRRKLHRGDSLKSNENDGKHVPNGFSYQTSTGSKQSEGKDDGGELRRMITDPGDECADIPMFLLEERHTGPWQRTFTLPHNIDMQALKAKLEGGLLRIDIPTKDEGGAPGTKVQIE